MKNEDIKTLKMLFEESEGDTMEMAKYIMSEIEDIDAICEIIVEMAARLNDKDKQWIIEEIQIMML